jgi:putative ABC transport system permease protein
MFARSLSSSKDSNPDAGALVLAGIAALMLLFMLLPALNLVNLNVGRIMERSTEIGVRKAFGASNGQLAAQLVLDNVVRCSWQPVCCGGWKRPARYLTSKSASTSLYLAGAF